MPWAGLDIHPPIYTSHVAGLTGAHHYAQLFYWLRWNFVHCLPWDGLKLQSS
jgi:hypothetical protein